MSTTQTEQRRPALPALRTRREALGLSLTVAAGEVGVRPLVLGKLERNEGGNRRAKDQLQLRLADLYHCTVDDLFAPPTRARYSESTREQLLANAGRCGSPTCDDPECTITPGKCHRSGCDTPATIATRTSAQYKWVIDYPTAFCGVEHARLTASAPAMSAALARWLREYQNAGYLTAKEVGAEIGRSHYAVLKLSERLGLGLQIPRLASRGRMVYTPEERDQMKAHLAKVARGGLHRDRKKRAEWGLRAYLDRQGPVIV
jgi:hypothetical protein